MARRTEPDVTWVDRFGDRLEINQAGENLVLTIVRSFDGEDEDHACVSLSPLQRHQLAAWCQQVRLT